MKTKLKINGEPQVTILWSEHEAFMDNSVFSFNDINKKLYFFNITHNSIGYYKTAFNIKYIMNGEEYEYAGRYDIGVEKGDLIRHITDFISASLESDDEIPKEVLELPAYLKTHEAISEFQNTCQLLRISNKKEYSKEELKIRKSIMKYYKNSRLAELRIKKSISEYCDDARKRLNSGNQNWFDSENEITVPQGLTFETKNLINEQFYFFQKKLINVLKDAF